MTIDDYLAAMERGLRQNVHVGRIEEPITCLTSDDYNGLVRCRLVCSGMIHALTSMKSSVLSLGILFA